MANVKKTTSSSKKKTEKKTEKKSVTRKGSSRVLHSVEKIQGNEKRYTSILVVVFMILFGIVGYYSLSLHNNVILSDLKDISAQYFGFSSFGQIVTLTNEHIFADEDGLNSTSYPLTIQNTDTRSMHYQVLFVPDEVTIKNCGCQDSKNLFNSIRYSLDGKQVLSFTDESMIIWQGYLDKNEKETLMVKLWFDSGLDKNSDVHFHGRFVVEKI